MLKASAIEHYGSERKVADALGITRSAVNQWGAKIPPLSAMRLDQLTDGALKFDPDDYTGKYVTNKSGTEGRAA